MAIVDHPHGGGRGKSKGNRHPTSPWGTPVSSISSGRRSLSRMLTSFLSPKVVSRHVDTTIPTSGLLFLAYGIWASEETRRETKHKPSSAYNCNCVLTLRVQYTAWSSTAKLVYRKKPVLYPIQPDYDTSVTISNI